MDQHVEERTTHRTTPPGQQEATPNQPPGLRRLVRGRGTGTGLTATGTTLGLAVAVGLGLFAAVSNTVLSTGNSAESGTYAYEPPPGPVEIEVALVDPAAPAGACDTATYDSAVLPAIVDATADLDTGAIIPLASNVCVRTAGTFDAYLRVANTNPLDVEVGACEPTESSIGLDATCLDGDQGELGAVIDYQLEDPTFTCPSVAADPFTSLAFGNAMIPAGTTCRYQVFTEVWPGAFPETLAAAQTDRITWDIGFSLVDDPFEPNDSSGQATGVLVSGTGLSATINPETDQDWYLYEHPGGTLHADTSGPCDLVSGDTVLSIYQSDGTTLVATNDDNGVDACSVVDTAQPAGDYYVVVTSYNSASFVSRYDLSVSSS